MRKDGVDIEFIIFVGAVFILVLIGSLLVL